MSPGPTPLAWLAGLEGRGGAGSGRSSLQERCFAAEGRNILGSGASVQSGTQKSAVQVTHWQGRVGAVKWDGREDEVTEAGRQTHEPVAKLALSSVWPYSP